MDLQEKFHLGVIVALLLLVVTAACWHVITVRKYEKQLVDLQNQAAQKDQTIELKDGLYHKLALQLDDAGTILDKQDKQQGELLSQLHKMSQQLLTEATVNVGLKEQIAKLSGGTQTDVPAANGKPERTKVDFHQDFGLVTVDGWTMTNPPQSWIRLNPGKPLTLTVSVAQDKDKAWHAYTTVDDPNFGVNIKLAAVNPYMFKPHWYEGFGVSTGLGVGSNSTGLGALVSVGINYKLRQYTFGPAIWLGINNVVDKYYGLTFEWRPFEQTH
jgi:hypothetical protein